MVEVEALVKLLDTEVTIEGDSWALSDAEVVKSERLQSGGKMYGSSAYAGS